MQATWWLFVSMSVYIQWAQAGLFHTQQSYETETVAVMNY